MTFSGGSRGSFNYASLPVIGSKKDDNPWGPDILHRLADQVEEAALGLPAAVGHIGKTFWHDTKHLFGGGGSEFELDDLASDIAKTTWSDLKWRWSPLVKGDVGEWWNRVEEDPLGTLLDLSTVVTGGAAGVAKAGAAATKAGRGGALSRAAGYSPSSSTLEGLIAARQGLGHPDARSVANASEGLSKSTLEALVRQDVKAKGGLVDDLGQVWDGPIGELRAGADTLEIPLAHNGVVRGRQKAMIALGNQFPNLPGFGASGRAARYKNRAIDRKAMREKTLLTLQSDRVFDALSPEEKRAAALVDLDQPSSKVGKEEYVRFYERRLEQAKDDAAEADLQSARQMDNLTGPQGRELEAVNHIQARLDALNDDAAWEYAQNPEMWSENFRAFQETAEGVSRATSRTLWEMAGRTYRGKEVSFDDYYDIQRTREARRVTDSDLDDLLDNDEITPQKIAFRMRQEGIGRYAKVRPHLQANDMVAARQATMRSHNGSITEPKSARTKRNTMATFDDAFDILDPRVITEAARQTIDYKRTLEKYDAILDASAHALKDGDIPKGWVRVTNSKMGEWVNNIETWITEQARVTFGDTDELTQLAERMDGLRDRLSAETLIVPKQMASELVGDLQKANAFIKKYDDATALWRHAALTARPVWITGNLVGMATFLMTTHGMRRSLLGLFEAVRRGSDSALDQVAPDVLNSAFMRSALEEMRKGKGSLAESKAKFLTGPIDGIRGLAERMLTFNAWVSDDPWRRAAFYIEIRPHVKEIQKATGWDFERAAIEWLKDPEVVDRLAQRVLSDLVDFSSLSNFEKTYLRRMMPFWSWIRGATGRTWRLATDEPWKVWMGVNASEWGVEQNEDLYGELPDWLVGMIGLGDGEGEQERIIPTASLNPYGVAGDVTGMAKSVLLGDIQVGGSNPGSMLNPMPKALLESVSNRDLFYGTPVDPEDKQSYGSRFLQQLIGNVPQVRLAEKARGALSSEDTGYEPLYENDIKDLLISYGLLPTRQLNVDQANARALAQQEGQTSPLI